MKICLLTPALPPKMDGIGDYTARLAVTLSSDHTVSILYCDQNACPTPIENIPISKGYVFENPKSVLNVGTLAKEFSPDWLIVQYNPFSYGRRGFNPYLPAMVKNIQKQGIRVGVMVHEPYVPVLDWKNAVMTTYQRWQLRGMVKQADAVFVSGEAWKSYIQNWTNGKTITHLPVGSNIPFHVVDRLEAREWSGIGQNTFTVGLFGSNHISLQNSFTVNAVKRMLEKGMPVQVVYIGAHGKDLKAQFQEIPFLDLGKLDADMVSTGLACMDMFATSFIDGISTRRTTVMAALEHGIPILGTKGHHTDSIFIQENNHSLILADAHNSAEFAEKALMIAESDKIRSTIGPNGSALFQKNFQPCALKSILISGLEAA